MDRSSNCSAGIDLLNGASLQQVRRVASLSEFAHRKAGGLRVFQKTRTGYEQTNRARYPMARRRGVTPDSGGWIATLFSRNWLHHNVFAIAAAYKFAHRLERAYADRGFEQARSGLRNDQRIGLLGACAH